MEENSEQEKNETKQALIIENSGFYSSPNKTLAIFLTTWGVVYPLAACALTSRSFLSSLITGLLVAIPSLVMQFAILAAGYIARNRQGKRLEMALEAIGYTVTSVKKMGIDQFYAAIDMLKRAAGPDATTIVCFNGHGSADYRDSSGICLNGTSISDKELVNNIIEIPGKTVLVVEACKAGGFANEAKNAKNNEKLVVVAGTDRGLKRGHGTELEKMMSQIAERMKAEPFVSQVNALNSERSWMKKINGHEPRVFCGKKMANFRV